MAKKEDTRNTKSKITVMMFQLEGTDETLQEGIRTIGHAIGAVLKPVKVVTGKPTALTNGEHETEEAETEIVPPTESEEEIVAPRTSSQPGKPRSPKILELDLKSVSPSLQDYCGSKNVGENDSDRYLVIAYWLKEHLKIDEVTMDHIHTCYRFLGWQTPKDASSPLRNMKSQDLFKKGTTKGAYAINHIGENRVMGMGKS